MNPRAKWMCALCAALCTFCFPARLHAQTQMLPANAPPDIVESGVTREMIEQGPDWSPGTPLPIDQVKAAQIGRQAAGDRAKDKFVRDIILQSLYGTENRKWYDDITFEKDVPIPGTPGAMSVYIVHVSVLMNGDAVVLMDNGAGVLHPAAKQAKK